MPARYTALHWSARKEGHICQPRQNLRVEKGPGMTGGEHDDRELDAPAGDD
jgi:hypothetical protein